MFRRRKGGNLTDRPLLWQQLNPFIATVLVRHIGRYKSFNLMNLKTMPMVPWRRLCRSLKSSGRES